MQAIIEQTEALLEKWKHPDPYRAPTAPGGSKYQRNLPSPILTRTYSADGRSAPSRHGTPLTSWYPAPPSPTEMHV